MRNFVMKFHEISSQSFIETLRESFPWNFGTLGRSILCCRFTWVPKNVYEKVSIARWCITKDGKFHVKLSLKVSMKLWDEISWNFITKFHRIMRILKLRIRYKSEKIGISNIRNWKRKFLGLVIALNNHSVFCVIPRSVFVLPKYKMFYPQ